MGNLFATPLPETAEFAAEFLRVQAAVAASACSPLQLEFVELKIVCAQYWLGKSRLYASIHASNSRGWLGAVNCKSDPYVCEGARLAHRRPHAWRSAQIEFFTRLLAQLEQEKSALQQGRPVLESPLPAIDEPPQTLREGSPSCTPCDGCKAFIDKLNSLEPFVRHSQESATGLTDFDWLPRLSGGDVGCCDLLAQPGTLSGMPDHVRVAGGAEGVHGASLASGAPYGAGAGAGAGTSGNLAMTAEYQPAAGMRFTTRDSGSEGGCLRGRRALHTEDGSGTADADRKEDDGSHMEGNGDEAAEVAQVWVYKEADVE
ncbi:hypothetical protein D9Q98_004000 [Chlorella vulgaris]|uniref:Uncharacterized protein n=1 Tax=Chlorella vulgaris TaxID=3077 RepID=A0A9D4TR49_CHLVU|nr:hypothetical protein D9Q98_004000 [Chlorella vulgaris]